MRALRSWALSLLVWAGLLVLFTTQYYVVFTAAGQPLPWLAHAQRELAGWGVWAVLAPLAFMFARQFPLLGRHRLRNAALHAPMALLFLLLHVTLYVSLLQVVPLRPELLSNGMSFTELIGAGIRSNFAFFLLIYGGIITAFHVLEYQRVLHEREMHASRLQARLTGAQLEVLRMQLQPHFLFNTLHGISALMAKDVPRARRMIANLSDLLRLSIDRTDEQEVSLEDELAFLERYVELQRMRFGDRLSVRYEVDERAKGMLVPQLLLQPLVENELEHGVAKHAGPSVVRIVARLVAGSLELEVANDSPVAASAAELPPGRLTRGGVGLRNTRLRLETLYGSEGSFHAEPEPPGGGYAVRMRIPARTNGEGKREGKP